MRGGYNVYPVEVEAVLSTHPDLRAVAVVPRPDPVMGEIGVAVVVPRRRRAPTLDGLRDVRAGPPRPLQAPRGDRRGRRAAAHRGREARPACARGAARRGAPRPVGRVRRSWSSTSTPTRRTCATRSARSSPPSARSRSSARSSRPASPAAPPTPPRCTRTWSSSAGPRSRSRTPPADSASVRSRSRCSPRSSAARSRPDRFRDRHAVRAGRRARSRTPEQAAALLAPGRRRATVAGTVAIAEADRRRRSRRPPP